MHADEQSIRELIAAWLRASKNGDAATVLGLMADDVVFLQPGQAPMRGRAAFAAAQSAQRDFDVEATADIREIRVFGDWAYCWNHLSVVVTPRRGAPVKRAGDVLSILHRQDGGWVILRDANMLSVVAT